MTFPALPHIHTGQFISVASAKYQVKPDLIAAIIHQESRGNPYAVRYEAGFLKKYLENKPLSNFVPTSCSKDTEKQMRATSFGLMQIMGQVARERGYVGEFLTELLDPALNIDVGTSVIKHHIENSGSVMEALLRYNGGANKSYGLSVVKILESGEAQYLLIP